jgi:uncharacterized protein involved in exopolysaccharide biosynthesis
MTTTPWIEVPSPSGLWRTLVERRRLVLGILAGSLALGLALNAFMPPVYRATVRVEFPPTSERSPWTGERAPTTNFQSENVALFTSASLITNRVLLGELAGDLSRSAPQILAESEAAKKKSGLHWLRAPIAKVAGASPANAGTGVQYDPAALGERVDRLAHAISVVPVADTRLVDIRVEDGDPVMARETADRLARMFVAWQQGRVAQADTSGLTFIQAEIAKVEERMQETAAKLARLGAPRSSTKLVRVPVPSGSSSTSSRDLAKAESDLTAARAIYRDGHPRVQELSANVAMLRGQARHPGTLGYETRLVRTAIAAPRQPALENELAVDEALFARLQSRAREISLERQVMVPAASIVEPATVEPEPIRPRPALNLAVCLLAGLFVAVGLALVKGSLSRKIRNAFDAERMTGLPVVAVLPRRA